jgi:DDB1- and CUL4-associated factor 6
MKGNISGHIEDRLARRELGDQSRYANIRGIYGDSRFVKDLDIVNELNGHSGCVNALRYLHLVLKVRLRSDNIADYSSWSTSGKILASGSDDRVINLYSYLPDSTFNQFRLTTQIDTGHSRNIFSVKFMPHSNDRKIVSCAGDHQVRIFDIERGSVVGGEQSRLSTASTGAKVFRSHCGSVKRIVTEASPFYFLTCSEDGDVRQWDIRQPESAYPRSTNSFFPSANIQRRDDAPPPLIAYHDYNIDLYTISCSPSQPHYIALGGTHLHCFLHDRRMLGRDKLREKGGLLSPSPTSDASVEAMMEATRCVRKFAPHGQPTMHRSQSAQITACKISNANPNELIASWSGDHVYSFDITREEDEDNSKAYKLAGAATHTTKKRKRASGGSRGVSQEADIRAQSRSRTESSEPATRPRTEKVSLLVRLRNGESVEIPIEDEGGDDDSAEGSSEHSGEEQPHSLRVAQGITGIKRELFAYHATDNGPVQYTREDDLSDREDAMIKVVCEAAGVFEMVDDAISHWAYPVTHSNSQVTFQQKLRDDRAKTWRFAQAAGTLGRVLLKMSPKNNDNELPKSLDYFDVIRSAPRESARPLDKHEQFCYDFIKTVLLWLDSGIGAVLREFTVDPDDMLKHYPRRQPVKKDAGADGIQYDLMPYLRRLATEQPIVDVDPDQDGEDHVLFESEVAAVNALERALRIPFADLQGEDGPPASEGVTQTRFGLSQPRETALKFWGMKVCRSLLRTASMDVDFALVDSAFDGLVARGMESATIRTSHQRESKSDEASRPSGEPAPQPTIEEAHDDEPSTFSLLDSESDTEDDDDDDDSDEDDEDEEHFPGSRHVIRARRSAGKGVTCSAHTRVYSGHCNVETTKDVNFYGLQDEYVVSGSDCGNLFIWDKKTTGLVTILQGDGEVVNVVQGMLLLCTNERRVRSE